jgi:hypothetical protein
MSRSRHHRAFAIGATLAVLTMTTLAPVTALGAGVTDRLPDLRMVKPRDVRLVKYTSGVFAGHRLLRFTTLISNQGVGPLELRGSRDCKSLAACPTMTVRQRIRRSDGTWRSIRTEARMQYEVGDGHRHWHAVGLERYRLWPLGVADPTPLRTGKYGFCFFDTMRWLSSAPTRPAYALSGCGTPSSLTTKVGLSAGWADIYPWNFSGQYIDVTGVPKGEYLLCVTADPKKQFLQSDTTNDEAWVRLRIAGGKLTIRGSQRTSCTAERDRYAPDAPDPGPDPGDSALVTSVSYARIESAASGFVCQLRV